MVLRGNPRYSSSIARQFMTAKIANGTDAQSAEASNSAVFG
jgi:hypothetical protein